MNLEITKKVKWVGKIDFELRKFHGDQISTKKGSSYNSYLIQDEKTVLVDLVYKPYAKEFVANLSNLIDLNKIDYIVVNHSEPDHSGALPELMKIIPETTIICTASGAKAIQGQYHQNWNFKIVKNGEKLNIGESELTFIEAPMMHWPDTMMCYLSGENILFSNDVFGQHFASKAMFSHKVDHCDLMFEAQKYFANIIYPFSKKAQKKLQELNSMNLKLDFICPAHGVIWQEHLNEIIDLYNKWTSGYSEEQVTIVYDSMYGSTQKIAEGIAEGISSVLPDYTINLHNASKSDGSDIISDIFKSKGILLGSSAINNGILNSIAGLLEEISNLAPENKKAAVFGSYGWSPKPIDSLSEKLKNGGYQVDLENLKIQWAPDENALKKSFELGQNFANLIK